MLENFNRPFNQNFFSMEMSAKGTILIAEDNEDSLEMLRTFLELQGYHVIRAADGEQAVEAASRTQPDLVIIDLNMPKLGGIAAAQQIRQLTHLSAVPILTNSSSGKFGMELFLNIEKLGGGYLEYIPKPFNLEYLAEMIETILQKTNKSSC